MAKFCSSCGKEINENAVVCLGCGAAVGGGYSQPAYQQPMYQKSQGSGTATPALVCSLIGLFLAGFIFGVIGLILGSLALGKIPAEDTKERGKAKTAVILGIVDIVFWAIIVVVFMLNY